MIVLITGGSGTVGRAFIEKYKNEYEFVNISQTEIGIVDLKKDFPEIKSYMGNIEDLGFLYRVFSDVSPHVVIHTAAHKHINLAEENPISACNINVLGSLNIINASLKADVPITIGISTDKACSPSNVYGSTKYLMEKCFLNANTIENKFSTARFANVAHSRGSVIPFWLSLKEQGKPLMLTNPKMNRLMMSQDIAANTINNVLKYTLNVYGGIIGSYKSKSVNMYSLAEIISDDIEIVGDRPGEKVDEDLINEKEIAYSYVYDDFIRLEKDKNVHYDTRLSEPYTSLTAEKMTHKEMEKLIWS